PAAPTRSWGGCPSGGALARDRTVGPEYHERLAFRACPPDRVPRPALRLLLHRSRDGHQHLRLADEALVTREGETRRTHLIGVGEGKVGPVAGVVQAVAVGAGQGDDAGREGPPGDDEDRGLVGPGAAAVEQLRRRQVAQDALQRLALRLAQLAACA